MVFFSCINISYEYNISQELSTNINLNAHYNVFLNLKNNTSQKLQKKLFTHKKLYKTISCDCFGVEDLST